MSDEPRGPQEPAGDVVRRLAADLAALLRLYGRAVAGHLRGLSRDVAAAALMIGAALALGVFALGLAVAVLVLVLAIWLPGWLAAAVVLGAVVAVMGALVFLGTRRVRRRRAAWAAMVEEEVRWLRSLFPRES
ncbi:MAG: phage holin family protein [Armatimonadota bacterium]|nr:phage holin family protein [Armatimonadota bacterium]MDR7519079.1 phage holin family protein [Armatimonadota bacterium]MDR7550234.1 phage holin family protein [Armatimonadota bacterium]